MCKRIYRGNLEMKNIVFYVHRTGLLGYFVNPICSFLKEKYDITVFHLDKRNGFSSHGNGDYKTVDLSDFSVDEIQQTLKKLAPEVVILLGFVSIYELLMLRIATDLGVKTIYLEHGIFSKDTSSLPLKKLIYKFWGTSIKNLFFLRQYRDFIIRSSDPQREKLIFKQCVLKKNYSGSKFSKALFFSDYGYKQINKFFQYDKCNIDFTGYPLTYDNKSFEELRSLAFAPLTENKKAILIHQPFILDGLTSWGYETEREYIAKVAMEIKKYGYQMTLLIHPRENVERYRKLYSTSEIIIKQNINKKDYKEYSLAIGYYSTALLYPVFLHIPLLIIDYGDKIKATDSPFYPLTCSLPIENFAKLMQKYDAYIREYIGTSECSFEHMAFVLDKNIVID